MKKEEIQEVLDELNTVEPARLNERTLRLFNAIMSIADERDLLKLKLHEALEYIRKNYTITDDGDIYLYLDNEDLDKLEKILIGE